MGKTQKEMIVIVRIDKCVDGNVKLSATPPGAKNVIKLELTPEQVRQLIQVLSLAERPDIFSFSLNT